jgi:hypothetical protein
VVDDPATVARFRRNQADWSTTFIRGIGCGITSISAESGYS